MGQLPHVGSRVLWRHPNSSRTKQRSVARQGLRPQAPCCRALSGRPREVIARSPIARSPDRPIARSLEHALPHLRRPQPKHTCAACSALVCSACSSGRPHACMASHACAHVAIAADRHARTRPDTPALRCAARRCAAFRCAALLSGEGAQTRMRSAERETPCRTGCGQNQN